MGGVCGGGSSTKSKNLKKDKNSKNVNNQIPIENNQREGINNINNLNNNQNNNRDLGSNQNNIINPNSNRNLMVLGNRQRSVISNSNIGNTNNPNNTNNYLTSNRTSNRNHHENQPIDILSARNIFLQPFEGQNNISINEEFSSRRAGTQVNMNTINPVPITLRHILDGDSEQLHFCSMCSRSYISSLEYQNHFAYCSGLRSSQMMHHSINEILHLVQTLNRQLQSESHMNLLSMLGQDEPEEASEYIDWRYYTTEDGHTIWTNLGKVIFSKEEMHKISKKSSDLISKEKYFIKRIWLLKYINKNIYDKTANNTTLVVSRENILEESFNQFMTTFELDLRKAMTIFFVDEVAHDVGGVYREWYTILFDEIFSETRGFFYQVDNRCVGKNTYFIPTEDPINYRDNYTEYYEFIGKVIGKAVFDKITIRASFNRVLLKLLLKKELDIEDVKFVDIGYYSSLKSIKASNMGHGNSELFFTWNIRKSETLLEEIELIPDGKNQVITEENKFLFIEKVVELICYSSIKQKVDAIIKGFNSLIPNEIVKIFSPEEFDLLLSGQNTIDLKDWKSNTIYKGFYTEKHPTIKMFWEILQELSSEKLNLFYKFCTGGTRVPIDGFNALQGTRNKYQKFCIESPMDDKNVSSLTRLIEAKTCFNRIYLPNYESKEGLRNVINLILSNDTNFFGKQ